MIEIINHGMNNCIQIMIQSDKNQNNQKNIIFHKIIHFILKQILYQKRSYKEVVLNKDKRIDQNQDKIYLFVMRIINYLNLKQVEHQKIDQGIYTKIYTIKLKFGRRNDRIRLTNKINNKLVHLK